MSARPQVSDSCAEHVSGSGDRPGQDRRSMSDAAAWIGGCTRSSSERSCATVRCCLPYAVRANTPTLACGTYPAGTSRQTSRS